MLNRFCALRRGAQSRENRPPQCRHKRVISFR